MKTLQRGFTLIELLVVIAIIGILSSIVLASLSSARSKGTDAAIANTLSNMRAQAELYYSNQTPNSYGSTFNAGTPAACVTSGTDIFGAATGLKNLVADLGVKASGLSNTWCSSSGAAWAVAAKGNTAGTFYCADSSGASKIYTTATTPAATGLTGASGTGAITTTGTACN